MHNLLIVFVVLLVLLTLISTFGGSIRSKEPYLDPELYVDPPVVDQEPEHFYAQPELEGYEDQPEFQNQPTQEPYEDGEPALEQRPETFATPTTKLEQYEDPETQTPGPGPVKPPTVIEPFDGSRFASSMV